MAGGISTGASAKVLAKSAGTIGASTGAATKVASKGTTKK